MLLFSLFFGLLAWAVAGLGIAGRLRSRGLAAGASLTACSIAVLAQFFEIRLRLGGNDIAGLLDTIDVTIFGVAVLLLVTILLNAALCGLPQEEQP
ncbi:MAG: hypothetical protein LUD84_04320 [Clostridiales bacterium]|nr:hypothetical protein [Clostridiales bacterium]